MSFRVSKHGEIIPMDTRTSISTRYKTLTKAMNREFWDSSSDTALGGTIVSTNNKPQTG